MVEPPLDPQSLVSTDTNAGSAMDQLGLAGEAGIGSNTNGEARRRFTGFDYLLLPACD
jgi:hypothetical protein